MSLAAIAGLMQATLRSGVHVERHLAEVETAQQILAGMPGRDELRDGSSSGEMAGHAWRIDATPFRSGNSGRALGLDPGKGGAHRARTRRRLVQHRHDPSRQVPRGMKPRRLRRGARGPGTSGFTLFEALVSVALMGFIALSLGEVTGQWLPSWHRGFGHVQQLELLDVGLQRIVEDLEAAEFVTPDSQSKYQLFVGDAAAVTLVRAAVGPDAPPQLEFVRLAEASDARGVAMVRSRAPFIPGQLTSQAGFADPVALVRAPFRISFAFAGADRVWKDTWRDSPILPTAVRVRVCDAASGRILDGFDRDASACRSARRMRRPEVRPTMSGGRRGRRMSRDPRPRRQGSDL